ncbi:Glycosyltransferase involved in cell wall bisynthesis [Nitrosomonas sp. Nm51]|uniref:DUF1972 domain-containing protein n=1 Tax=Nitrosomonas sp. Nm51 TaxID=133720 RepID=UPI0008D4B68E|nr:DUF1972 domain-containing protein [Nitrosomonas sp. Nm51]SEQ89726.1 Glycosyltransferase involved in cell wall bisynthesis [Nitrosomonas sp. Nm51]
MPKTLRILGTRGIPAQHGGFETFAEHFALFLVKKGWRVIVYCQEDAGTDTTCSEWEGIERVHIPVSQSGAFGTIVFDWKVTVHAAAHKDLLLTLGYNTAVFCVLFRLKGLTNLINMDGIEWKRGKWSLMARTWLYLNERAGCWLGNHLVADHPEIENHLATRVSRQKITMLPYGSDALTDCDAALLDAYGLQPGQYALVIARPEPENSILEIVMAFSRHIRRKKLMVLGDFDKASPAYREQVFAAASGEVVFPGAIYDAATVQALRYFATAYVHGHQVGGTNPSLVEALGAGSPVIAHDNKFNRWVAGPDNLYFENVDRCCELFDRIFADQDLCNAIRAANQQRHRTLFTWDTINQQYLQLIEQFDF